MSQRVPISAKKQKMRNKGVIIFTLIAIALILIIARIFQWSEPEKIVTDFTSCAEAGFPVMESYPRQCIDKDQQVFVEKITEQATSTQFDIKTLIPVSTTTSSSKTIESSNVIPENPTSSEEIPKTPAGSGVSLKNSSST